MRPVAILRIAAIVALLQFLAHTTLFLTYTPAHGPDEVQLVDAMKSHIFNFSGYQRSYWDMYFGYGLFSAFNCLLEAIVLWLLASLARKDARAALPIVGAFAIANVVYTVLVRTYFFALPSYFDIALAMLLVWAIVAARTASSRADATGSTAPAAHAS